MSFKCKLKKLLFISVASSGLLLLLETSRILRKTSETFKAEFDKILRNIQAEGQKFVSYKKCVCFFYNSK